MYFYGIQIAIVLPANEFHQTINLNIMKATPHILVIDDETHICESCDRIFSNAGYKVDTNINATLGFRQALSNPYDAIILDLNLVESDGLNLLYGIRKRKPDVPVVIITGYPSEDSRRISSTLGVTDYIIKPFGPSEILEPVEKAVYHWVEDKTQITDQEPQEIREFNYHFYQSSWFYQISNGLVRTGGYLPDLSSRYIKSIKLPEPETVVYRGLPIAEVSLSNGMKKTIPSPVSGRVMVINDQLKDHFYNLEKNIHTKSWIAVIEPFDLQQDLQASEMRSILVFAEKEIEENEFLGRFRKKGYISKSAMSFREVMNILAEGTIRVLFMDARRFSESGPRYVKKINKVYPDVKVIVFNEPDVNVEMQYRKCNILYYGVNPVSNNELVDALHCAFMDNQVINLKNPKVSAFLPDEISKISITNRHGVKVTLFAFDGVLKNNYGIGYLVTTELKKMEFPIWLHHTRFPKTFAELTGNGSIAKEKETSNRIIILQGEDLNMIPGSISRTLAEYSNEHSDLNQVVYMNIQPAGNKAGDVKLDGNTTLVIKDLIMNELVSG